jgi:hypothetical protein
METLTHWKKLRNPDYLGTYAMPPDGSEVILTIRDARQEQVPDDKGKKSDALVIHFVEPGWKPMILNATNSKTVAKLAGSPYVEKWKGTRIQLYTTKISAFGTETDALRIRTYAPQQPAPAQVDPAVIQVAIKSIQEAATLDQLKETYTRLTAKVAKMDQVVAAKDRRKAELTEGGEG